MLVTRFQIMTQTDTGIRLSPLIDTPGEAVAQLASAAKEHLAAQLELVESGGEATPLMQAIVVTMVDEP